MSHVLFYFHISLQSVSNPQRSHQTDKLLQLLIINYGAFYVFSVCSYELTLLVQFKFHVFVGSELF